jgi:cAMP-binding proteins - catabolite gene activator and regulatory subunit of cAMP-dependent protein kinases
MQESKLELLQGMPVFGGVRETILRFLLEIAPVVSISKGNFFFRENDKAVSMFVLEQGRVVILKRWKEKEYLLRYFGKGDCFGEMALIDMGPRSASVLAVEDCQAIEISAESLYELYKKDLEQFTLIQMNIARELSRRLRAADERLFQAKVEARLIDGHLVSPTI